MYARRGRERTNSWRRLAICLSCLMAFLFCPSLAVLAENWTTVYQNDFASDPGWTTNNAAHYYWDSSTHSYYQYQKNGSEEYAFHALSGILAGQKWRLEFDINPVSNGWAANTSLGLFDSDMTSLSPCNIEIAFARIDAGLRPVLQWGDVSSGGQAVFSSGFDANQWYHALLEWDPSAGTLYGRVTLLSDGSLVGEQTATGLGSITGIDRLAISEVGHTYASGATAYGYIDNVVVSQTPEPATLSLLALGGLALIRRKRASEGKH